MTDPNEAFVMVPREPTEEMLIAVSRAAQNFYSEKGPYPRARAVHRALIAAATVHGGQTPVAWMWRHPYFNKGAWQFQAERPPPDVYAETTPLVPATVADMVSRDQEVERLREALRAQVRAVIEYEMGFFTPTGVQAARCILHKLDEKVFARAALGDST